jgi:general secretion pathway protein D
MQVLLKTVLKAKDIFVNEKTNSIVMRDTPEVVALAVKLLAAQDLNEPEVMLEMEVLEVTQTLATKLGIEYPSQVSVAVGDTIKTLQDWKGVNATKFNVNPTGLGVVLNLKKADGDVNTLANPRIRVRQHEKAKIHIGKRYPIITNSVTPSTSSAAIVTGSIQYIDLGLKLEVEPEIHMDSEVGIKTSLEVSSLGGEVTSGSGDSKTTAPIVNSRTVNTVLRLKDGETQILAGLISNDETNDAVKVPGLGDVPLFGKLFTSNKHDKNKTELVLAITPHIIRNIQQSDANLTSYWSGTDGTVRSHPITVEKMDTMKMESRSSSALTSPVASTIKHPVSAPDAASLTTPVLEVNESLAADPATSVQPIVIPNSAGVAVKAQSVAPSQVTPEVKVLAPIVPVSPQSLVPRAMPRGAAVNQGSAGMSDAVVDPTPAP